MPERDSDGKFMPFIHKGFIGKHNSACYGQVNDQGELHGIGREITSFGDIIEG